MVTLGKYFCKCAFQNSRSVVCVLTLHKKGVKKNLLLSNYLLLNFKKSSLYESAWEMPRKRDILCFSDINIKNIPFHFFS